MKGTLMNLIEEIEADYKGVQDRVPAYQLLHSPYWPRIKAALEAAQEMDYQLDGYREKGRDVLTCQHKFRKVMK
jgi:hypothetical protein